MRIETISTGDELLTGLTSDTNSRHFQELLLERLGDRVRRAVVVGDNREDIVEALNAAAARCEAVLVSGGLGPTADDITIACAAEAANVPLVESAEALRHLEERFRARGVTLTPNNRRVALVPKGAEVVLNSEGSAPMVVQRRGGCVLFFVPGVPREYRHLVTTQVLPRLETLAVSQGAARRYQALRLLKTIGLPESHLDEKVRPLFAKHPKVTFGFRTHAPENHLKLHAIAATATEARAAVAAAEQDSRAVLGQFVYGADDDTLPLVVGKLLRARQETLSTAESCTAGMISALITEPAGSSDYFVGGAATYQERMKTLWAGVPAELIAKHGVVSEEVARAMAAGMRAAAGTTWALSVTGYAGPSGGDEKNPVGTVYLGVSREGLEKVERHVFQGDRERVRLFAAATAVDLLRRVL